MNDRVQQQTLHVDENMSFLAFDQFARIEPVRINAGPLFSALHALAVDDASGGAGLSLRRDQSNPRAWAWENLAKQSASLPLPLSRLDVGNAGSSVARWS